ncbi:urea ABC transporter permease subunit UrtB, partial [Sinorhizobium meliloti]
MYRIIPTVLAALFLFVAMAPGLRAEEGLRDLVNALGEAKLSEMDEHIAALAKTGKPEVVAILEALGEGELYARKADGQVFLTKENGSNLALTDPISGDSAGEAPKAALSKIRVNNSVRRAVRTALGSLTLLSPDRNQRLRAAQSVLQSPDADALGAIENALAAEKDGAVRAVLEQARATMLLLSDRPVEE